MISYDVFVILLCMAVLMLAIQEEIQSTSEILTRALWYVLIPTFIVIVQCIVVSFMSPHNSYLLIGRDIGLISFLYCAGLYNLKLHLIKRGTKQDTQKELIKE